MSKKLYPGDENSFDKSAKPINIPSQFDNKDYGKKSKMVPRKVRIISSGKDKKFYGARTIYTKEEAVGTTFKDFLISDDDTY